VNLFQACGRILKVLNDFKHADPSERFISERKKWASERTKLGILISGVIISIPTSPLARAYQPIIAADAN
jgi:hypothetical protein